MPELDGEVLRRAAAAAMARPGSASKEALRLQEQATVVGAYRWVEQGLFSLLGGWVADEADPESRIFFDEQSQLHAWHARLFGERLPVLDWIDPEALTVAPTKEVARLFEEASVQEGTAQRLSLLCDWVFPALVSGYTFHLERASAVCEAPLIRSLVLVVRDDMDSFEACLSLREAVVGPRSLGGAVATQFMSPEGSPDRFVPWPEEP